VVYKPDRIARSMKELLVLLEDQLHARGINLHVLSGICAGTHRPDGATIADKMLFMVAAMAAEMERDLIRERTLDGRTDGIRRKAAIDRGPLAYHDALVADLVCDGRDFVLVSGRCDRSRLRSHTPASVCHRRSPERDQQSPYRRLTSTNNALQPFSGVSRSYPPKRRVF
jgi:hypothetical protein